MSRRIFMQDLSGSVSIVDLSVDDSVFDPDDAEARYRLNSSGAVQSYVESVGSYFTESTWLTSGLNSQFEVRATATSGTVSTGTVGAWMALSTSREWTAARTTVGFKGVTLTIEIRRASNGVVLDTATISISAEVD